MYVPNDDQENAASSMKDAVLAEIEREPLLIAEHNIRMQLLDRDFVKQIADHYMGAREREDFSLDYSDPDMFINDLDNPQRIWIIFTHNADLVGSTGLFYRDGAVSIDETQIDPSGRGHGIMNEYFRRIVPALLGVGTDITTEFVLTLQSKGLRRTLQGELGFTALGIHPNILTYKHGTRRSEISAAKYSELLPPKGVEIVPELHELYNIVQCQLDLPHARTYQHPGEEKHQNQKHLHPSAETYTEISVSAVDQAEQLRLLREGYMPVKYDPKSNIFCMAKFPAPNPDLGFIRGEGLIPNNQLVDYLNSHLYSTEA